MKFIQLSVMHWIKLSLSLCKALQVEENVVHLQLHCLSIWDMFYYAEEYLDAYLSQSLENVLIKKCFLFQCYLLQTTIFYTQNYFWKEHIKSIIYHQIVPVNSVSTHVKNNFVPIYHQHSRCHCSLTYRSWLFCICNL